MADISPNTDQMENGDPPEGRKSRAEVLFVSDTEMFRRIGISEKIGRIAVRELEKRLVFPPKDPLFGNKRYWPAVKGFLDARSGSQRYHQRPFIHQLILAGCPKVKS